MARNIDNIRNIGIIAHIDAGKTTVTERMLFYSHFVHRVGMVDQGTTVTDFDPEEQERGITINSACVTFQWKKRTFNLIDTPGHVDFTAEVERCLRVLDGAVVVFSAREGVEAQSETVWRQADRYHVPRIAFINKMDREGADFYETLEEIEKRLEAKPVVLSIPVGAGPPHLPEAFRGVIDLIEMQMLTFSTDKQEGKVFKEPIPEEMEEEARKWRTRLLDDLSLYSDELTELILGEEEIPKELIIAVLRKATIHDLIVPLLCGSALDGIGIQPLIDAAADLLPSPADMPPIQGQDPSNLEGEPVERHADDEEPFCGLLFKIQADKHGDLHYVRLYSGFLKQNSRVFNPRSDQKENVPQLWRIQADRRQQVSDAAAGDIVGVIGLRNSVTGDTLCDAKNPILLENITFPETVISMAIEPETIEEHKKLSAVLDMMKRQDPTFRTQENEETGQMLISGMGELHLEVIKHRLLREHKVKVRVHNPRVSYRESVQQPSKVVGECGRTIGGTRYTAEMTIRMEPKEEDENQSVEIRCDYNDPTFTEEFRGVATEALFEESQGGGQLGFPLINVRITIVDVKVHETETNEMALRVAAGDAFRKGLQASGIVLLEPIMRLEIATPEEYMGDFVSDLQQRRAIITKTHTRGKLTLLEAEAPLANLFGYSSAMRSLSQGRATSSMEPLTYGPAPPDVIKSFML